jgi:hypothetical protein
MRPGMGCSPQHRRAVADPLIAFSQSPALSENTPEGGSDFKPVMVSERRNPHAQLTVESVLPDWHVASVQRKGETMSQSKPSSQTDKTVQKDQKPTDEQRRQEQRRGQSQVGEQHETGSSSNSQPGSGPG